MRKTFGFSDIGFRTYTGQTACCYEPVRTARGVFKEGTVLHIISRGVYMHLCSCLGAREVFEDV